MYAVIEDSGSQLKVSEGDVVRVDRRDLPEDANTVTFDRVLAIGDPAKEDSIKIGMPVLEGAKVTADVLGEGREKRVPVVKFKRRKTYLRRKSHRQPYLKVKITSIQG